MKERAVSNEAVDKIKFFIRKSCRNNTEKKSRHYRFHKSLVERYFEARNVEILYEKKTVKAEISVGNNNYTTLNFTCLDLSTFLSSCIREDHNSLRVYLDQIEDEEAFIFDSATNSTENLSPMSRLNSKAVKKRGLKNFFKKIIGGRLSILYKYIGNHAGTNDENSLAK